MDLILVSGGASVGEKDFTRLLLERLGFNPSPNAVGGGADRCTRGRVLSP
jgi:hypothetical protein